MATEYSSLPLFRFGHGLSYTTFSYKNLVLLRVTSLKALPDGGRFSGRHREGYLEAVNTIILQATITVCNTGTVDGTEVVQVFSRDPLGVSKIGIVTFWKRLVGFGRIFLHAGLCGNLPVNIIGDDLAQYDDAMDLRIIPGNYTISAGGSSDMDILQQWISL